MARKSKNNKKREPKPAKPAPEVRQAPPEIAAIIDAVMADDRRWFEEHPGVATRQRRAVVGEFWPMDMSNVLYVIVSQVQPGFRLRGPVVRLNARAGRVQ
ncbi:MAG TPA: hypothetical protein VN428_04455 [Bryobacteraceae bacterium]|nr:hypothetical protein [Bryobacteraceae bacterium]